MERLAPSIRQGTDGIWTITLRDANGQSLTGVYDGTEPLGLVVWPGSTRSALTLPNSSAVWLSPSDGTITLTIHRLDTALIDPGMYELVILLVDGSIQADAYRGILDIQPSPGLEAAPKVYCTLDDCRRECSWILDAVIPDENIPNNLERQRADARAWYDDLLQRHWRGGMSLGAEAGLLARRRSGQRNMWLQAELDAGCLMLTVPVIKANAYQAIGYALRDMIGARGSTSYQELAAQYFALAEQRAACTTAEIDTNADGTPDYTIDLGFIDVLRG